jgi:hypothetical protein
VSAPLRLLVLTLALGAFAAPVVAQGDDEPDLIDIERDELECATPPSKWKRPSDSWQFLDLDAMRERMAARGENVRSLDGVAARLWFGSAQGNIVVRVRPHPSHTPPELETLGQQEAQAYVGVVADGELKKLGGTRVGKRPAVRFEIEGKNGDGQEIVLIGAVTYRAEDNQIFTVLLDVLAESSQLKTVKKDFKTFLKKAKV